MAPRARKAVAKSPIVKKVAAANGRVTKTAKKPAATKKASSPVKKTLKAAATATESKAKSAKSPAAKKGPVDAYFLFEVCKSCHTYKRNANQIFNDITAHFPKKHFELVLNQHGLSRRGSFEITVSKKKGSSGNATLIWSGIAKGPPRKLKFPESAQLFDSVKSAL